MISDIILIGPIGAGKSTVGKLLAEKLRLPQCSMDSLRFNYYKEIGYDENLAKQIREEKGLIELYWYWKSFEAYAVERLLSEHSNCVIDFGAGHSVYEDDQMFARIQQVLAPYNNIVLMLPSPDLEDSLQILNERRGTFVNNDFDLNKHFLEHYSNFNLAKIVVYTKDKSPEQTCNEILNLLQL
ncbi:MAG: AAA family ATPase [Coleofasciculus sp. Co-bin14]|nr:AAA family ATPase [Coleofasciculus sp. Co-bin14]